MRIAVVGAGGVGGGYGAALCARAGIDGVLSTELVFNHTEPAGLGVEQ